ncbi:hypothetical protein [Endozoicomonas sp.]|uniref:hypothetical protein n=1 Tax=Endozoicomonas sp. TaxID=1892382 RepID=UPI002886D943|nr:hypothetical protein [Endozoicomonas sp.]
MNEIRIILELAIHNYKDQFERSEDLNTLYQNATDSEKAIIDKVIKLIGSETLPKIWVYLNR